LFGEYHQHGADLSYSGICIQVSAGTGIRNSGSGQLPYHLSLYPFFGCFSTIPSAILRLQGKPFKYMLSKVAGSLVYFLLVIFFIRWLPNHPEGILGLKYNPDFGVGYVFVANLIQSIITLLIVGKNSSVLAFRNLISVYGKEL
jgi:hypothetical protein